MRVEAFDGAYMGHADVDQAVQDSLEFLISEVVHRIEDHQQQVSDFASAVAFVDRSGHLPRSLP
jgi:hypothetical protein